MIELFIAYRHIKERKFQSIVSIIGVSLALIVFFTSLSISNGLKKNTINSILSLNPHITVGFHTDESKYEKIISDIKEIDKESCIIIQKTSKILLNEFTKENTIKDKERFDIIYLDPPYDKDETEEIKYIIENKILNDKNLCYNFIDI